MTVWDVMAISRRLKLAAAVVNGGAVAATLALLWLLLPAPVETAPPPTERLAAMLPLFVGPAAVVLAMVVGAMAARAIGEAYDPIDDPETRLYRVCQRALTNTVEQAAIFLPGLAALVATMQPWRPGAAAMLVAVWVGARLLFWAGYLIHPYVRAPGMSATLTVGATTVFWALAEAL
jgi:hypothetical protein